MRRPSPLPRSRSLPSRTASVAAAAAAALLSVPAAAQAATLTFDTPCAVSGQVVPVAGTGFTPGATVTLTGEGISGSGVADRGGAIATTLRAYTTGAGERTVEVVAKQGAVAVTDTELRIIAETYRVNANLNGDPRATTEWTFAGFPTGRPVFGHFRFRGRTLRTYRFGVASGPCGTLQVRAPRLPVRKLRYGTWTLKFDASRTWSRSVVGRHGTMVVRRR